MPKLSRKRKQVIEGAKVSLLMGQRYYNVTVADELLPFCQLHALNALFSAEGTVFTMQDLLRGAYQAFLVQGHFYPGKNWKVAIGTMEGLKHAMMAKFGRNRIVRIRRPCGGNKTMKLILESSNRERVLITGKINSKTMGVPESSHGVDHASAASNGMVHDVNLTDPMKLSPQSLRHIFQNICRVYRIV